MNEINIKQQKILCFILILVTIASGYFLTFKDTYSCLFSIFITLPVYASCLYVYYICILTNYLIGTIVKIPLSLVCTMGAGCLNLLIYVNIICRLYEYDIEIHKSIIQIFGVYVVFQLLVIINTVVYDFKIKKLDKKIYNEEK